MHGEVLSASSKACVYHTLIARVTSSRFTQASVKLILRKKKSLGKSNESLTNQLIHSREYFRIKKLPAFAANNPRRKFFNQRIIMSCHQNSACIVADIK